jgi:hypothetical protein
VGSLSLKIKAKKSQEKKHFFNLINQRNVATLYEDAPEMPAGDPILAEALHLCRNDGGNHNI